MAHEDSFRRNPRKARKETGAIRARYMMMKLDGSQRNSGKFYCLVEDSEKLWSSMLGKIVHGSGQSSSQSPTTTENLQEEKTYSTPNPVITKAAELPSYPRDGLEGKFYLDSILSAWDIHTRDTEYVTGDSRCKCVIDGQEVVLAFNDRCFGIVDLDKPKIGQEGRIINAGQSTGKRKIRTNPRDTESMFVRLNPEKVMNFFGLVDGSWPAIHLCARRLTSVALMMRDLYENGIPAKFLNPKFPKSCKKLNSFLKWNSQSLEIEIDVEGLFNDFVSAQSGIHRPHLLKEDNKMKFLNRLRFDDPPDDMQGHVLYSLIYFMNEQQNGQLPSGDDFTAWDTYKSRWLKCLKQLAPEFTASGMATDIKKWFCDRDILVAN